MKSMDRRDFLKMAGAGSAVVVAGTLVPVAGFLAWTGADHVRFRAVVGMPKPPLPAYASYVIEGDVNIAAKTGRLAKSVYAGAPGAMSGIVFPGTVRTVRVTDVQRSGDTLRIAGVIDDQSNLLKGESPEMTIVVDRLQGTARANFLGSPVLMRLE